MVAVQEQTARSQHCYKTDCLLSLNHHVHAVFVINPMPKNSLLCCWLALLPMWAVTATVTVVTEIFPPYQTLNQDNILAGCSTAVVKTLLAEAGDDAQILVMPWSRAYTIAEQEPNVMIYSIAHNEARHHLFYWLGELVSAQHNVLEVWGLAGQFSATDMDEASLKAYSIATTRNSSSHQYLQQKNFSALYPVTNLDQGLQMLKLGRVDLVAGSELSIRKRSAYLGINFSELRKVYQLTNTLPLSIAFNKDSDAALLSRYQTAWDKLATGNIIQTLMQPCLLQSAAMPDNSQH